MNETTILVVDDEDEFRSNLTEFLGNQGFRVLEADRGTKAYEIACAENIAVALVDIFMPEMDGMTLLGKLQQDSPDTQVLIITGEGTIDSAVEAMHQGAFHYITKPVRLKELGLLIQKALDKWRLNLENERLRENRQREVARKTPGVIAESSQMVELLKQAEMVASSDMPVLIEGETGTGKEVIAEFIHRASPRKDAPFVVINCGALTENLMDAELFGHEKGAFTGAGDKRLGMIEVASEGTLFLDEIGDIPLAAQVRLLRFLEQGVVRRVGATREIKVNVRIMAATHRQLKNEVTDGRFREDLYHRLRVFPLVLPPLRERPKDILPLAEFFLGRIDFPDVVRTLSDPARARLLDYGWPGNVRELAHTLERASLLARLAGASAIGPEHLALMELTEEDTLLIPLKEAERRHVERVLHHLEGNRQKSAEVLGISERHLYRLLRQFSDPEAPEA